MKRTGLAVALLLSAALTQLGALDVSDPQDEVYRWLDLWQRKDYIDELPYLKPYPVQLVEAALVQVTQHGRVDDQERAQQYLEDINKEPTVYAVGYSSGHFSAENGFGMAGGYAATNGYLLPQLTASGALGAVSVVSPEQWNTLVPGQWPERDYMVDFGAVTLEGLNVLPTVSAGGAVAYGSSTLWLQAGFNRNAYGPFQEGPVLSPQAAQAGHFSVTIMRPRVIYSNYLLGLTATRDDGTALEDDGGVADLPDKYMAGQSLQVSIRDWLEFSFFENIVFGERLELLYLVPAVPKLYTSVKTGAVDNMMMGFGGSVRLPADVGIDTMLYMDDLHFLDLIKLDFDTKYKIAGQIGVSWTPLYPTFKSLSANYALVTPYTYTHRRESIIDEEETYEINYYNYTHSGRSMVALLPNSDRIQLSALMAAPYVQNLDVALTASFRRHANATTDVYADDTYEGTTDGGINDNGYDKGKPDHNFDTVEFLSQDLIEKTLLLGVEAMYRVPLTPCGGEVFLKGGYDLELSWNKRGEDPNDTAPIKGNDVVVNHLTFSLIYEF